MIEWWDDANHLVNWALLSGAVGVACRNRLRPWTVFSLVVGFCATTAILWETAEYFAFIRNSPELVTAYSDTPGDVGLGLAMAGSSSAASLATISSPRLRVRGCGCLSPPAPGLRDGGRRRSRSSFRPRFTVGSARSTTGLACPEWRGLQRTKNEIWGNITLLLDSQSKNAGIA